MAIFTSKVEMINKILSENIHENIRFDLKERVMSLIEPEIEKIVDDTVKDLVTKIESFNNIDGTINLKVMFSKEKR